MKINKKIELSKDYRKHGTKSERILWKYILKDNKYHWIKQRIINGYIVDFYCDILKMVIEVDDDRHDIKENYEYDIERSKSIGRLGIKIVRLRNEEIQKQIHDMVWYVEYLMDERYRELFDKAK